MARMMHRRTPTAGLQLSGLALLAVGLLAASSELLAPRELTGCRVRLVRWGQA